MRFGSFVFALVAAGLLLPDAASAHHGWVDFNEQADVTVEGTVTAFYFVNPHCAVEFDVKNDSGQIQKWEGEFASKQELLRKGWNAASLEAGDKATFTGHPAKNGSLAIHVVKIRLASGEVKLDERQ
jgi:hypothetical protein